MANKKRHNEVKKESQIPPPINYKYLEDDFATDGSGVGQPTSLNEYLSDSDLKKFLLDGYLIIKPTELVSVNPQWHSELFQYVSTVYKEEGNLGNNVLARFPQLNEIFQDEKVRGVLTRVLGREYVMQSHRFMHFTEPGTLTQQWHKDSYFGHGRQLRSNQLRNVMLMYYPQKTVLEMGPTALRKGTQYTCIDPKRYRGSDLPNEFQKGWNPESDLYMECEAGSLLLIHYDLIHKGSKNDLRDRAMFKFQFSRVVEPQVDSDILNNGNGIVEFDQVDSDQLDEYKKNTQYPIAKHIWNWLHNIPFNEQKDELKEDSLNEKGELLRMANHYRFALNGQYSILLKRMDSEHEQFSLNSSHAMVACRLPGAVQAVVSKIMNGKFTHQNGLIGCMYVLAEWGPFVRESLDEQSLSNLITHICSSKNNYQTMVKIYVAEALGSIFCNHNTTTNTNNDETFNLALDKLMEFMTVEEQEQARYVSVFSALKISSAAERCVRTLNRVLKTDQCRYVVGFSLDALERIGTRDSMKIVLEYLKATRWCFMTTKSSQF